MTVLFNLTFHFGFWTRLKLVYKEIMAVFVGGRLRNSAGPAALIAKQVQILNLKPVKRIQVQFDPFHENAVTLRYICCDVLLIILALRMIAQA